jgi:hypothetical protein
MCDAVFHQISPNVPGGIPYALLKMLLEEKMILMGRNANFFYCGTKICLANLKQVNMTFLKRHHLK